MLDRIESFLLKASIISAIAFLVIVIVVFLSGAIIAHYENTADTSDASFSVMEE